MWIVVTTRPHGCGDPVREAEEFDETEQGRRAALTLFRAATENGGGFVRMYRAKQVEVELVPRVRVARKGRP